MTRMKWQMSFGGGLLAGLVMIFVWTGGLPAPPAAAQPADKAVARLPAATASPGRFQIVQSLSYAQGKPYQEILLLLDTQTGRVAVRYSDGGKMVWAEEDT